MKSRDEIGILLVKMGKDVNSFCDLAKKFKNQLRMSSIGGQIDSATVHSFASAIWSRLNMDECARDLESLLDREKVEKFFEGYAPTDIPIRGHLVEVLLGLIPSRCTPRASGAIELDTEGLLDDFQQFLKDLESGETEYVVSLRLAGIDMDKDYQFSDGLRFQKLTVSDIEKKYPVQREYDAIPGIFEGNWRNHRVEAVFLRCGTPAQIQHENRIEEIEALVNSIVHAFLLAGVTKDRIPRITHVAFNSLAISGGLYRGVGGLGAKPSKLSSEDLSAIQSARNFLELSAVDKILQVASDRFFRGMKTGTHHPNHVNEPNWDKILDYVIAMESLFLTSNGQPVDMELSYRFGLNGSSIISKIDSIPVENVFHALRNLYAIRSLVVHGCANKPIMKRANAFIRCLNIECSEQQHSLGRLQIICGQLEKWIRKLFFYLGSLPEKERPYRARDGWEHLLWKTSGKPEPKKKKTLGKSIKSWPRRF